MKFNQKGFTSGILAAVVTILVVVGIFYAIEKYGNNRPATIAGWQDYTSSQYDFSVDYPPNYTLVDNGSSITITPNVGKGTLVISPASLNGVSVFDSGHSDLVPGCQVSTISFGGRTASSCTVENSSGYVYHTRITDNFSTKWDARNEIYFSVSLTQAGMTESLYQQILKDYQRILSTFKLGTIST